MKRQTSGNSVTGRRAGRLVGALGFLLVLCLIAGGVTPAYADDIDDLPIPPHGFAGTVSVTDMAGLVPEGTLVEAFVDGEKTEETTVDAGGKYLFLVPGSQGATVTFRVGGVLANESATWVSGQLDEPFDLTIDELPLDQYNLTISSTAGGSVTSPGEGTFPCYEGMVVDLVAEVEEGYRFANWTGHVNAIGNVDAAETTITIGDHYSITANFEEIPASINRPLIGGIIAAVVVVLGLVIFLVRRRKST